VGGGAGNGVSSSVYSTVRKLVPCTTVIAVDSEGVFTYIVK
jgi:hypothetical protein